MSDGEVLQKNVSLRRCFVGLAISAFMVVYFLYNSYGLKLWSPNFISPVIHNTSLKDIEKGTILLWTDFASNYQRIDIPEVVEMCPLLKDKICTIIRDSDKLDTAHAVLINWRSFDMNHLPKFKVPGQIWVLTNEEAPTYVSREKAKVFDPYINWTVTYRRDSDFVAPYGRISRKTTEDINVDVNDTIAEEEFQKKQPVAWMVSNCKVPSNRQGFVEELRKNIPVTIYGSCGNSHFCSQNVPRIECYGRLAKQYKFYLSFENSLCKDYVTEKFFLPLSVGIVPVTFGAANYTQIAPPDSFINALDFKSPKHLADHLQRIGANYTLYKKYVNWKENYKVDFDDLESYKSRSWACDLCARLTTTNQSAISKQRNLSTWWFEDAKCWRWESSR